MKTNQIMIREFSGLSIRQEHKTKMFSATDLAQRFPGKQPANWLKNAETEQLIQVIMERENLPRELVVKTGKGKGEKGGTWLHPIAAVDFAMWLSPDFKYDVIKWVLDNLCQFRDEAGDNHKLMSEAIFNHLQPIHKWTYADETYMVQDLAGINTKERNLATEEQLKTLSLLQKWNAKLMEKEKSIIARKAKLREMLELFNI